VHLGKNDAPLLPPRQLAHFPADGPRPDQTLWDWPAHIDPAARPWLRTLRALYDQPLSFPFSLSPQAGLLLHSIVLNAQPRTCVEVGSGIGIVQQSIMAVVVGIGMAIAVFYGPGILTGIISGAVAF